LGSTPRQQNERGGVQTKRIAGPAPYFQPACADLVLPPLSFRQQCMLANQNTFDNSSLVFVGLQAVIKGGHQRVSGIPQGVGQVPLVITGTRLPTSQLEITLPEPFFLLAHGRGPRYYTPTEPLCIKRLMVSADSRLPGTMQAKETFDISTLS